MEQLLYWFVGGMGVPLIQYLKNEFGWRGKQAVWLASAVSVALAFAALFVSHELALSDFTMANLVAVFGQVIAAATLAYKLLMGEEEPPAVS